MKKIILSAMAAMSLATTSTMAVAAPMPAPVVTPLTQPASEQVAGDNEFVHLTGLGALLGLAGIGVFIAVIIFAVKSGDKGGGIVIRTSP